MDWTHFDVSRTLEHESVRTSDFSILFIYLYWWVDIGVVSWTGLDLLSRIGAGSRWGLSDCWRTDSWSAYWEPSFPLDAKKTGYMSDLASAPGPVLLNEKSNRRAQIPNEQIQTRKESFWFYKNEGQRDSECINSWTSGLLLWMREIIIKWVYI